MVYPKNKYVEPITPATGYNPRKYGADCDNCPFNDLKPIPSDRRRNTKLAIVGEAPGGLETQLGEYFVGESGKMLKSTLRKLGVKPSQVHINNAIQCEPPFKATATDWKQAIKCCRPRLENELRRSGAEYILALGKRAFHATTKYKRAITDWAGCTLPCNLEGCKNKTVLVSIHPAFVLRGNKQYAPVFKKSLDHSWRLATKQQDPFQWQELYYYGKDETQTLDALKEIANGTGLLGFDIETAGSCAITKPLIAVGVANSDFAVSLVWPLERHFTDITQQASAEKLLRRIFKKTTLHKVAHNGSHDVPGLQVNGFEIKGYKHDTILYHAVYANTLLHNLGFVSQVEFACEPWKQLFKVSGDAKGLERFTTSKLEDLTEYNAKDSAILVPLAEVAINEWMPATHNGQALYDGYFERANIAANIMTTGAMINQDVRGRFDRNLRRNYNRAETTLREAAGEPELSATKNKELHALFFDKFKVPITKRTPKGNPKLDRAVLDSLLTHHNPKVVDCIRALLRYKKYKKLHSTYIKGLRGVHKIHPQAKVWGTKGGRWSYNDIVQLVPKSLRSIFRARPGNWIIEADYKQFEIWIMAHLSQDKTLLGWLTNGLDVHTMRAKSIFGDGEITKPQRQVGKMMGLAVQYGAEALTVWQQMQLKNPGFSLTDVEQMIETIYFTHPGIKAWQREMVRLARKTDYVECPVSGRRQKFYKDIEPAKCYNYPVQGTAADIMDGAIPNVFKAFKRIKDFYLLFQVHDALICDVRNPYRAARILHKHMTAPVSIRGDLISFDIDFKVGRTWGDCKDFGSLKELKQWWEKEEKSV